MPAIFVGRRTTKGMARQLRLRYDEARSRNESRASQLYSRTSAMLDELDDGRADADDYYRLLDDLRRVD